jgi:2-polyprenyl-3-methyl-5-hydroxy-6-metoxy-1,4-benzoquinol methylase
MALPPSPRYQDFVIKEGRLVGDFEGLYKNFEDPWHQSRTDHQRDTRRQIAINWAHRLRDEYGINRVLELGCGFGHLTDKLRQGGFSAVGVDISQTAIDKARETNPSSVFIHAAISELDLLTRFSPDVFVMAEITWYVLDELDTFLSRCRDYAAQRRNPTYLIHLLTTYAPGVQKYGREKFTNLDGILQYFKLDVLESGCIKTPREDDPDSQGTYFIAKC